MELGFRTSDSGATLPVPAESLLITGSLDIVDARAVVQYHIKDPDAFVSRVADPEGCPNGRTLRDAALAALSEVVGQHSIDDLLTHKRPEVEEATAARLQEILDSYGTGINVLYVNLLDVSPPDQVRGVFDDVLQARRDKESIVEQATASEEEVTGRARGDAAQIIKVAEARRDARIARAETEADSFVSVLLEYEKVEAQTFRKELYLEALDSILPGFGKFIVAAEPAANRPKVADNRIDILSVNLFLPRLDQQTIPVRYDLTTADSRLASSLPCSNFQTCLDNLLLLADPPPEAMPDRDKGTLIIDSYARYRIIDPVQFRESLQTESIARFRLGDIITTALRAEIAVRTRPEIIGAEFILDQSGNPVLDEYHLPLIKGTNFRSEIIDRVLAEVTSLKLDQKFGIEVVDVRMKKVSFPDEVATSVYARMRAERGRIAGTFRNKGEVTAAAIRAEIDTQVAVILAEAQSQADTIIAEGRERAIDLFIQTLVQVPDLIHYRKSLEAYKIAGP